MVDWLLKGEPREVQLEALRRSYYGHWMKNALDDPNEVQHIFADEPAKGWGHFLEMRLGKTPTMLNEFELFRRDHGVEWMIMLSPNKYKGDWGLEAERFGSSVPVHVFDSGSRDAAERFPTKNSCGIMVVNYEALIQESTCNLLEAIMSKWSTYFAADESISIKGHDSTQTVAAIKLAKRATVRRISTGKPISQGPHDLWAQLRFAGQLEGFVYHAFRGTFCKMGGFKGKQIVGTKNEDRLQEVLSGCSWAARKADWLRTPGRDYTVRPIVLIREQKVHYDQMHSDFLTELANGAVVSADQIITKLLKLQQISSGFIIDEVGRPHDIMPPASNPKVLEIKRILADEVQGKTIIYCVHRHMINMLMDGLKDYNPAFLRGSQKDVIEQKNRFNGDPNCRVMIGQVQAIKYGHTLMGTPDDPCYTEIFAENNYSLNDRSQCEERPQGEGQLLPITIIDLVATPQERAIIEALQKKEDVAAAIMGYARSTGILPPEA